MKQHFWGKGMVGAAVLLGLSACATTQDLPREVNTGIQAGDWLRIFDDMHYAEGQHRLALTEPASELDASVQCMLERQNYVERREAQIEAGRFRIQKVAHYSEPFGGKQRLQLPEWLRPAHVDFFVTLWLEPAKYGETAQLLSCYQRFFAANGARYPNLWDIQSALRNVGSIEKKPDPKAAQPAASSES